MEAIKIINLEKKYGDKTAVNKINLNVERGELVALLGVNGAGKTTTIKMLTGLTLPTSGEAFLNGKSILKDSLEIKKVINVSPQETAVAPNLSVYENLDFIAGVYSIENKKETVEKLINEFKLTEVRNQKAKTLSGGWMRRLSIAMSLVNDPEILFLDEPTLGLDVIARRELWKIIESLKKRKTIILTTHYMEEAEILSDHIAIMAHGQIVSAGTKDEILSLAKTTNFEDAFVTLATGGEL